MSTDNTAENNEIQELKQRVEQLEQQRHQNQQRIVAGLANWADANLNDVKRRSFLLAIAATFGIGLSDVAAAQDQFQDAYCEWSGNIDANNYDLFNLGTLEFADGSTVSSAGDVTNLWESSGSTVSPKSSYDTVQSPAITTDSITDNKDGLAWETLRELGYESGDVFTLREYTPLGTRQSSTTSTTFTTFFDLGLYYPDWPTVVGDNTSTTQVKLELKMTSPGSETPTARYYNQDAGEEIASVSSSNNGKFSTGWVEYTPTLNNQDEIRFQGKTDIGSGSVTFISPVLSMGVKLP